MLEFSGSCILESGETFTYQVACTDENKRLAWTAQVYDSQGRGWLQTSSQLFGVQCADPFGKAMVRAAVLDAIREHRRFSSGALPASS
jgi:hypothetical protein